MRRAARNDAVAAAIDKALIAAGCSVMPIAAQSGGEPDRLVGCRGRNILMEYKTGRGKLRDTQVEWHERWRGEAPLVVRTPLEALMACSLVEARLMRNTER